MKTNLLLIIKGIFDNQCNVGEHPTKVARLCPIIADKNVDYDPNIHIINEIKFSFKLGESMSACMEVEDCCNCPFGSASMYQIKKVIRKTSWLRML